MEAKVLEVLHIYHEVICNYQNALMLIWLFALALLELSEKLDTIESKSQFDKAYDEFANLPSLIVFKISLASAIDSS